MYILDNCQGEERIVSSRYEDTYQQGLLYSTRKYAQYLIHEGKESEKAHGQQELDTTYQLNHHHVAVYLKLIKHCKLTIFQ